MMNRDRASYFNVEYMLTWERERPIITCLPLWNSNMGLNGYHCLFTGFDVLRTWHWTRSGPNPWNRNRRGQVSTDRWIGSPHWTTGLVFGKRATNMGAVDHGHDSPGLSSGAKKSRYSFELSNARGLANKHSRIPFSWGAFLDHRSYAFFGDSQVTNSDPYREACRLVSFRWSGVRVRIDCCQDWWHFHQLGFVRNVKQLPPSVW